MQRGVGAANPMLARTVRNGIDASNTSCYRKRDISLKEEGINYFLSYPIFVTGTSGLTHGF